LFPESLDDYVTDTNPVRVVKVFVGELNLIKLGLVGRSVKRKIAWRSASGSALKLETICSSLFTGLTGPQSVFKFAFIYIGQFT
jgi:hypothetical protein